MLISRSFTAPARDPGANNLFKDLSKEMNMLKRNLIILALFLFIGVMNATLLMEDNFTGTPGDALTTYGWTAHSGVAVNPALIGNTTLSYSGYPPVSGYCAETIFTGTTSAEDAHKAFGAQTSGSVYVSFLVNITTTTNASGDYFLHFGPATIGTDFKGRIFWKKDPAGSNIAFGLAKAGNAAAATYTGFNYQFDTTYLIVMRYDIITGTANDVVKLWINPSTAIEPTENLTAPDVTGTDIGNVGAVAIRQGNPTSPIRIDGIRVATLWADLFSSAPTNVPPVISSIVQSPASDIVSTTTVSVSANVTDESGVYYVALKWGTATGVYPNTIEMNPGTGDTYTTASNIPAQATGTTVYYVIYAEDDEPLSTTTPEQSYTVIAPATTTIPYTEAFSAGWGATYRYDVAGTHPWYIFNNDNATCNGYGGTLEEHWLVLPAINFNNYAAERMTFNTIATYGLIDANNYLKLMYSSNYFGLGDPTSATWTEIPYTAAVPQNPGIETPSGVLDLSGIAGTNVYLAFKYHSTDQPSRWEVDDINIYTGSIPVISVVPATLTGFTYYGTGPSAAQTFTVSGADLTANIILTASTNYEISLSEATGYTSPLTLTQSGGTVPTTTIYVRLKSGLAVGEYNGETINITSTGADPKTVTCSGEVTTTPPPGAPVALAATNVGATGFTANWQAVTGATGYYLDVYTIGSVVANGLFFSEYIEGTSNNKALEIFNGTGAEVDLSDYQFENWYNGLLTPYIVQLSATPLLLASGDVFVLAHTSANASILALADLTSGNVSFNGDDAVVLRKISTDTIVDIFGRMGEDPGTAWGTAPLTTVNQTLRRKITVLGGVLTNPDSGFPTLETEWEAYDVDNIDNLGLHTINSQVYVPGFENLYVGNVTSYPVTGLSTGVTYYYVVRATNTYGTSLNSNEISVTTIAGLNAPVVVISRTGDNVTLTWEAVAGATSYQIWAATNPFGTYTLAQDGWTSLTWSEISAAMKFYKVIAKN